MAERKLHIGCGKRDFGPEWIHIDGEKYPHVSHFNVKKLPFLDGKVDVIYASHLISYFDRFEIMDVLYEWRRVLKPGGLLRLATTDFYKCSKLYLNSQVKLDDIHGPIFGRMDMSGKKIYHKTVYDYPTLSRMLMLCGFGNVRRYDHDRTEHALFDDHSKAYLKNELISLNVECNKL
jgi:predicted SAM-dependent methyltransferase